VTGPSANANRTPPNRANAPAAGSSVASGPFNTTVARLRFDSPVTNASIVTTPVTTTVGFAPETESHSTSGIRPSG